MIADRRDKGPALAAALCCLVFLAPAVCQAQGNKALMEQWSAKKRQVKEKVFQDLQKQGVVPRDGTIEFEARIKPEPGGRGGVTVQVDSIRVAASPPGGPSGGPEKVEGQAAAAALSQAFKPVDLSGLVTLQSLDVPVGATVVDAMTVRNGRLAEDPFPAPEPTVTFEPQAKATPEKDKEPAQEKGWWEKFKEFLGF